jgi:PPOX class probable F420-dependent enzyme
VKEWEMAELTEKARKHLSAPNFAYLATVNADGSPQVSPVWVDVDDGHILVNTAVGRVKERNVRRDPRVALSVGDRENQYDKVDIRGRVVDWVSGDEAYSHIDKMAQKYMGQEKYPWLQPDEERVIMRIEPEKISEMG